MRIVKVLGFVDIITALLIYTNVNLVIVNIFLFIILLIKGFPSLGADWIGKFYGVIDIISAFIILFNLNLGVIETIFILVLLFKGVTSLL